MPPHTYLQFPLRWESTGDQWWFASPIDWAAANGHYDLVRELLHIDPNLLIKLTSLRRIRRLETVWDDEEEDKERCNSVAKCRSQVAQKLLQECETKRGYNSLIRAGYGGWLLYTAASAGDLIFAKEMLDRDPLLVFGEGEYGITDILYAAARSRSCEVFRVLLDCAVCPKGLKGNGKVEVEISSSVFKWELMNRAVHAAVRGGNIDMLRELLLMEGSTDILGYRDGLGSTLLHTASGRGQVEVVEYLVSHYDCIICTVDNLGNTALHVAAFRGHLAVMEVLTSTSPSSASITNNYGDTFLHMAVAGFTAPSFKRLDTQMELMKQLVAGKIINIENIINTTNNQGRTALHMAAIHAPHLLELLMSVGNTNLNICDAGGNTPLDLLMSQPPQSASLIKRLVSNCQEGPTATHRAFVSSSRRLRTHSPGTSFRIPDAELILHAGLLDDMRRTNFSGEIEPPMAMESRHTRLSPVKSATRRLKILLRRARTTVTDDNTDSGDNYSSCSVKSSHDRMCCSSANSPVSLRRQFLRPSSTPTNKRILSLQGNLPGPYTKKKFGASVSATPQALPKSNLGSPLSVCSYSESSWSSPQVSTDIPRSRNLESCSGNARLLASSSNPSPNLEKLVGWQRKGCSFTVKLMNRLFLFGRSKPAGC